MSSRKEGVVKWFNAAKGFGFIEPSDQTGDLFVHFNEIEKDGYKTLDEGERVSFEVETNDHGLSAKGVRVI